MYIKIQLTDNDLPRELKLADKASMTYTDDSQAEHLMLAFQFTRFKAIKFMLVIGLSNNPFTVIRYSRSRIASASMITRAYEYTYERTGTRGIFFIAALV